MKTVTALATAIGTCWLAGSIAVAQETYPTPEPATGQGATTDESMHEQHERTADASGMQHSKMDTKEFVKKAGASGAAEVASGRIAMEKATNPQVRAFAQHLVSDHTKANKELMAKASAKNIEVPTEPGMMQKGMMDKLEHTKAGPDFDRDFVERSVRDHESAVELFQKASTDTNVDPEFRALAKQNLPTLQQHLKEAKSLEGQLAKNQ